MDEVIDETPIVPEVMPTIGAALAGWELCRVEDGGIWVKPPTFSLGTRVYMRDSRREFVILWSMANDLLLAAELDRIRLPRETAPATAEG